MPQPKFSDDFKIDAVKQITERAIRVDTLGTNLAQLSATKDPIFR